jgi:hypothetical protein
MAMDFSLVYAVAPGCGGRTSWTLDNEGSSARFATRSHA